MEGLTNNAFAEWRAQFARVAVKDAAGVARSVKGYIVATRFATEFRETVKSTICVEDPDSPGELSLGDDSLDLGNAVIALHYSELAQKLNQPILAESLAQGFSVPSEIQFPTIVWELQIGPLKARDL